MAPVTAGGEGRIGKRRSCRGGTAATESPSPARERAGELRGTVVSRSIPSASPFRKRSAARRNEVNEGPAMGTYPHRTHHFGGSGGGDNGDVRRIADHVNGAYTQQFDYDFRNRITLFTSNLGS
jgi:hypothetical protein